MAVSNPAGPAPTMTHSFFVICDDDGLFVVSVLRLFSSIGFVVLCTAILVTGLFVVLWKVPI